MKKYVIAAIVLIVFAGIVFIFMAMTGSPISQESQQTEGATNTDAEAFDPSGVSVAITSEASLPGAAELLKKRLDEIGFSASIVPPDPAQTGAPYLTVLYRPSVAADLDSILSTFSRVSLVRKLEDSSQTQDIVISAWGAEDIKWGSFEGDAKQFTQPDPAAVSILVLNAGAEAGEAGQLATLLKEHGFTNTDAQNSDSTEDERAVIYYRRNFRSSAKELQTLLRANGYPDATYRLQTAQEAGLVIALGAAQKD